MPAPRSEIANSLSKYTSLIEGVRNSAGSSLWFRGIGSTSYLLSPTLYRHPTLSKIEDLINLESELLTRFRHRSIPYQSRPLVDQWELLFMMQHYGVPTRLLDWSENPFIALYFAITSAENRMSAGAFTNDAAVWLLHTGLWNSKAISPYWKGRVMAIPDSPLEGYQPGTDLLKLSQLPVAMAGLHNSPRIVAQRGAFTIFGHQNTPMEILYDQESFPADALIKIVLPKAHLSELRDSLFGIGYADSMIYPDLSGLAIEIKRSFGFGA